MCHVGRDLKVGRDTWTGPKHGSEWGVHLASTCNTSHLQSKPTARPHSSASERGGEGASGCARQRGCVQSSGTAAKKMTCKHVIMGGRGAHHLLALVCFNIRALAVVGDCGNVLEVPRVLNEQLLHGRRARRVCGVCKWDGRGGVQKKRDHKINAHASTHELTNLAHSDRMAVGWDRVQPPPH
jgi:hypothetical protein